MDDFDDLIKRVERDVDDSDSYGELDDEDVNILNSYLKPKTTPDARRRSGPQPTRSRKAAPKKSKK